jgi:hypothetical protein
MFRFASTVLLLVLGGAHAQTTVVTTLVDADYAFQGGGTVVDTPYYTATISEPNELPSPAITANGQEVYACGKFEVVNKLRPGENINAPVTIPKIKFDGDLDYTFTPPGGIGIQLTNVAVEYYEVLNIIAPGCTSVGNSTRCFDLLLNVDSKSVPFSITQGKTKFDGTMTLLGLAKASANLETVTTVTFTKAASFYVEEKGREEFIMVCTLAATSTTTVGHDPHLMTWKGERYDFHGECDLLLLHNPEFANGLGMDVHARTKIRRQWSYIDHIAVRIGNDILEVQGGDDNLYWINGVAGVELPATVGGYSLTYHRANSKQRTFIIELDNAQKLEISTYKEFVIFSVKNAQPLDFGTSVGLHGNFYSGAKLARDGVTVIEDPVVFGQEWQVRGDEPHLFRTVEGPQHPHEQCKMPSQFQEKERRRRLSESTTKLAEAEAACAHIADEDDRDNCVFDVILTDDLGMAASW